MTAGVETGGIQDCGAKVAESEEISILELVSASSAQWEQLA